LVLHLRGIVSFDMPALILCFIGLAPWLSLYLEKATLPGGWRLEFRRLLEEQEDQSTRIAEQRAELDTLKFLIENLLTKWERAHLQRLNAPEPFPYDWQRSLETELARLLALEFIERQPHKGMRSAAADRRPNNDLHDHFRMTEKGIDYLARVAERTEGANRNTP
jgi:hypothetical protein